MGLFSKILNGFQPLTFSQKDDLRCLTGFCFNVFLKTKHFFVNIYIEMGLCESSSEINCSTLHHQSVKEFFIWSNIDLFILFVFVVCKSIREFWDCYLEPFIENVTSCGSKGVFVSTIQIWKLWTLHIFKLKYKYLSNIYSSKKCIQVVNCVSIQDLTTKWKL